MSLHALMKFLSGLLEMAISNNIERHCEVVKLPFHAAKVELAMPACPINAQP